MNFSLKTPRTPVARISEKVTALRLWLGHGEGLEYRLGHADFGAAVLPVSMGLVILVSMWDAVVLWPLFVCVRHP